MRVGRLRKPDLELVLEAIREIDEIPDLAAFPAAALAALEHLVPCEWSSWTELDFARREHRETVRAGAGAGLPDGFPDAWNNERERWLRESPLVSHYRRTGDSRVLALSRFLTREELQALPLYRSCLGPLGMQYQLLVPVDVRAGGLTAVVLHRSALDYSRRERELLGVARGHVVVGYRAVSARARMASALQALEDALAERGEAVAVVTGDDRIALATPRVSEWLAAFFAHQRGDGLPEELASWVQERRASSAAKPGAYDPRAELTVERDGRCMSVRFVARDGDAGGDLLLFAERRHVLSTESFAPLGLRRREAEVLALVARGLSDGEIASTLVVSRRTVEKHLEHVYQSLGVRGRTAAVAFALAAMGLPL
jgi:DNA-binding CsgD family transcriptional regulator